VTRRANHNVNLPTRCEPVPAMPIESYVAALAAALPGPVPARADIIAELRAGLLDCADTHQRAGLSPTLAAQAAVAEFGDPLQLAASFRPGLAARHARHVTATLLATGPVVGLLWLAAAHTSHIGARPAPPWRWANTPPIAPAAFPLMAAVMLVTITAALLTLAATGRVAHRLGDHFPLAPITAAVSGFGAATLDLILLALLVSQLTARPETLSPLPVTIAAAASLTRLHLAKRAGTRCLTSQSARPQAPSPQ
jgi:hypothetical protein